ncbi:17090_t:CDS:2, partial [Racocetra persica]
KQIRSLDIIKDVFVKIAEITIPISIEIILATTYSLILENDCHYIIVSTIYEYNQAMEEQPIISKIQDKLYINENQKSLARKIRDVEYVDKLIITLKIANIINNDYGYIAVKCPYQKSECITYTNCGQSSHQFKDCLENKYK